MKESEIRSGIDAAELATLIVTTLEGSLMVSHLQWRSGLRVSIGARRTRLWNTSTLGFFEKSGYSKCSERAELQHDEAKEFYSL